MSGCESAPVTITTFINPHLFWFFEDYSTKKRLELETQLKSVDHVVESAPTAGQILLVQDSVWKRARIKDVEEESFRCWLIDYGVVHTCNKVYVLPKQFSTEPAMVKQAALHKIVGVTPKLDGVSDWQHVKTIEFNVGAVKCSKGHIGDARKTFFRRSMEKGGVLVGEISILNNSGQLFDLSAALVSERNCVIDDGMFEEAFEANSNLDRNGVFIEMRSSSSQGLSPVEREVKTVAKTIKEFTSCRKGLGRGCGSGHSSSDREKLLSPGSKEELKKIEFVEKWVQDTRAKASDPDPLQYESDEDSKNGSLELRAENASTPNSTTDMEIDIPPKSYKSPTTLSQMMKNISEQRRKDCSISPTSRETETASVSLNESTKTPSLVQRIWSMQKERKRSSMGSEASPGIESKPHDVSMNSNKSSPNVPRSGGSSMTTSQMKLNRTLTKSTDGTNSTKSDCSPSQQPIRNGFGRGTPQSCGEKPKDRLLNMYPAGMGLSAPPQWKQEGPRASLDMPGDSTLSKKHGGCLKNFPALGNPTDEKDSAGNQPKTPFCDCLQCTEWDTNEKMVENVSVDLKKPKKLMVLTKPPLLLKTDTTENEKEIAIDTHVSVLGKRAQTEHALTGRILVHGQSVPIPITTPTAVAFHTDVHRGLDHLKEVYTIQSYVWPALMHQMNVCMVHTAGSGKTWAYLPAVCSYLLERGDRYKKLPPNTMSPLVIVLCPNSKAAETINEQMTGLLSNSSNKPIKVLAVPPVNKTCLNQFRKPCDALVTTPVVLTTLLTAKLINTKRLCHLVIESADVILQRFFQQLNHLLNLCQNMLSHRTCSNTVQVILTAETWTLRLDGLVKRMVETPLVCIGTHLEAAMYGRVNIEMKFFKSNTKTHALSCLLKEKDKMGRTMVVCGSDAEVKETEVMLQDNAVAAIFIYDTMRKAEILEMETRWHLNGGVLVRTDHTYDLHSNISSAVLLIHYSLPATWSQFAHRFGCMLDNYKSPMATKVGVNQPRCNTHIFVDESNNKQLPKLIQLLQRMGAELPPKFFTHYKETVKARELAKLSMKRLLCPNLQLFGKCTADNRQLCYTSAESDIACLSLNCTKRHVVSTEVDYSSVLPTCGVVKFRIVHVQDVSLFTVKLLEHTDLDGKVHRWDQYETLEEELQGALQESKIGVYDAQLEERYALQMQDDNKYSRCVVKKIFDQDPITKKATRVSVRLLESGLAVNVGTSYLYELPQKFRDIPAQGVDVYLANVTPPEGDESWSGHPRDIVNRLLLRAGCLQENVYTVGQILLRLNGILWVKNALIVEKLDACDLTVTKLNLRKALKDQGLIAYSEQQLQGLYRLCEEAGIVLPDYTKLPPNNYVKPHEQVEPQWAFFDNAECNAVFIASLFTPDLIYLRLVKFSNLFEALQKEIQEAICRPFYPKGFAVTDGKYYLAKDPGSDDYARVKVTEIRENIADCFFVDFGDSATVNVADIKYLSNEMITKLPFQAIECRLYGVKCAWDEWDSNATDILSECIFEPGTDYYLTLYATTCKEERATTTGGQKCAVLLIDYCKNKTVLINQLLINCGGAVPAKDEDLDEQFAVPENYVEAPDEYSDDYDEEITFTELKEIRSRHGMDDRNNNDEIISNDNVNCDSDEDHHWDIVIPDPHQFIKELCGLDITPNPKPISTERELLPPMNAVPSVSYSTPEVVWYQTPTHIKLRIIIPDVTDYNVRVVRNKTFVFRTTHNGTPYKLDLVLFAKVTNTLQDSPFGTHVHVTLIKTKEADWPRLLITTNRMRNIQYDFDHCVPPEEKKKLCLTLGSCKEDEIDGLYVESGSEYGDSDLESVESD